MESDTLDQVTNRLQELIRHRQQFEARHGHQAAEFLDGLPALFRLFYRLNFDLEVAAEHRRKAASIAVYIAESHDFCGESNLGVEGLIDDLWVAYKGLSQMMQVIPPERLERHWRSPLPFGPICSMAHRLDVIEPQVPSRVLDLLKSFME